MKCAIAQRQFAIIMLKAPPLPFPFPDTPPVSPDLEAPGKAPTTPRTPRKPKEPRKAACRNSKGDSAIFRFEFESSSLQDTPTLKIRVTTRGRSLLKARRRLWRREYEPLDFVDLDILPRKQRCAHIDRSLCADDHGTDADDELEGRASYLSPPHSPDSPITNPDNQDNGSDCVTINNTHRVSNERKEKIVPKMKTCASCKTKKTPLWRDSEDGTPYCNACGIRFKKYRIRCSVCLYIPRKDEKVSNCCCICGSRLVHCRVGGR